MVLDLLRLWLLSAAVLGLFFDCSFRLGSSLSSVVISAVVLDLFRMRFCVYFGPAFLNLFQFWFRLRFWSCFDRGFEYDFGLGSTMVLTAVVDVVLGLVQL